ncbi:hypothetical protein Vadar_016491 [Vaccinium darrowii]|uniref:Uncharacterized protein n=1 Tax=Vaccinium darrowii TaxID=229202 RepID=A0ACB7YML7_9ERIC|nr:hypothetical protein Vadar_016491 [Vaccinium darrowii]
MQKMASKEIILFLMVSFHFCYPASLLPLGKNSTSARLQENLGEKETNERKLGNGKVIAHRSNFAAGVGGRGGRGGGGSRGDGGSGEEGNGGSSTTPNTGAGTAVVPLYAAGANGHRNNHHGSASSNRSCVGLSALCAVILASLVVHIYKVLGSENLV